MILVINKFEYEYLKSSVTLNLVAEQHNKTVKEIIKEHCEVDEDV